MFKTKKRKKFIKDIESYKPDYEKINEIIIHENSKNYLQNYYKNREISRNKKINIIKRRLLAGENEKSSKADLEN